MTWVVARTAALVVTAVAMSLARAGQWTVLPDLVLLIVVATALRAGPVAGATWGLVAGWVVDLVPPGGAPIGLTAIALAAAGAVAGAGRRSGQRSPLWFAVVAAGAALVAGLVGAVATLWAGAGVDPSFVALGILLTAGCGSILVPALVRLEIATRAWSRP